MNLLFVPTRDRLRDRLRHQLWGRLEGRQGLFWLQLDQLRGLRDPLSDQLEEDWGNE